MNADDATEIHMSGNGRVIGDMGAKRTHKLAIHLINRTEHEVVLIAYTFDLPILAFQCDQVVIIGSTNCTHSSQNNQEISAALAFNAVGLRAHTKRVEEMRQTSEPFSEVDACAAIDGRTQRKEGKARDRTRSAPSEDR